MKKLSTLHKALFFFIAVLFVWGCSTQKENASNRALQNLSARYNLIYNSHVLLDTYQENLLQSIKNDYDRILPVYYAPFADFSASATQDNSKELEGIAMKAQNIIADKKFSNYIDDAYILLGKTNFYKGNYFNAYEYFDYVAQTYKKDKKAYLNAINWKARSLMQLNEDQRALKTLDTLADTLSLAKKERAEPLATLAQMSIYQRDYQKAIPYLLNAIEETPKKSNKIRWNYILAQLFEMQKDYGNSLKYYTKVEKSNAAFDMYFNAKLSEIRVNDLLSNRTSNRKAQLARLLRDDKNADFVDQIYFEIGEDYYADGDFAKALENYKIAVEKSTVNQSQKGIAYLKIADLNFKELNNYVNAKLYYDSAVTVLPKNYPNYEGIVKKAENLKYLTERYETIKLQDTLQKIALLPEGERKAALTAYLEPTDSFTATTTTTEKRKANKEAQSTAFNTSGTGTFYFSNATAVSRGFNDFKKKWGTRKLEDNWRQSVKSSSQSAQQAQNKLANNNDLPTNPDATTQAEPAAKDASTLIDSLPLTAIQKEKSNQRIILAYLNIANFYQQILNDKPEAIKTYEILLKRFPNNDYLDIIYYSLYLGYKDNNNTKAEQYKNLVLSKFPSSVYAKTILDPSFSLKQSELDATLQQDYNQVFERFVQKDFATVIGNVNQTISRFPGNTLEPQYAYLKSIAIGRTQNVDSLITAFKGITTKYPNDKLVKPLVDEHLIYINAHLSEFKKRKIALVDFDPNEPKFFAVDEEKIAKNKKDLNDYNAKQEDALNKQKIADSLKNALANTKLSEAETKAKKEELAKAEKLKKLAEMAKAKTADSLAKALNAEKQLAMAKFKADSLAKLAELKKQAAREQKSIDSLTQLQQQAKNSKLADSLNKVLQVQKDAALARQKADSIANVAAQLRQTELAKAKMDSISRAQAELAKTKTADSLAQVLAIKKLAEEKLKADSLAQIKEANKLWQDNNSKVFYAVIAVNRIDISLSSSRFGVGQFNRGGYAGENLRHNLKELKEDQLIFIGDFSDYNAAKNYEIEISKQLSKIMKVPPTNYTTFVISKDNFEKVKDRVTLTTYQNFIRTNEPEK